MGPLRPPGFPRAARHADRLGPRLEALVAAHRNRVFGAIARKALDGEALPPPWLPQETTTRARSGASEDAPKALGAPRPADGHRKDGRADLTQGLLSLGGRGDGGWPLRLGLREGKTSDRGETPLALAACLSLGRAGVPGIVAASTA